MGDGLGHFMSPRFSPGYGGGCFYGPSWGRPSKLVMGGLMTVLINHSLPVQRHFQVEGPPGLLQPLPAAGT